MAHILSQDEIEELISIFDNNEHNEESAQEFIDRVVLKMRNKMNRELKRLNDDIEEIEEKKQTLDILYDYFTRDNKRRN